MTDPSRNTPAAARTRVACKACHSRRVKCDAADAMPCMHCRTRHTTCELIDSKRGRWTRQKSGISRRRSAPTGTQSRTKTVDSVSGPSTETDSVLSKAPDTSHGEDFEDQAPLPPIPESIPPLPQPEKPSRNPGDSLTLSYILEVAHQVGGNDHQSLGVSHQAPVLGGESSHHSSLRLTEYVSVQEALIMPERQVSDRLIWSFFKYFHPAYPVVDRSEFTTQYAQGRMSPILLHTIYMVALTCGPEELVHMAGHPDRTAARKWHYLRAKALYDSDHETDDLKLAAALHLLSFWWLGPNDQKDSWYWQGCAVTLAQSLGMHRSTIGRGLSPRRKAIWKRIWWSIYIRDRHVAAALCKPCRIRDEDCDAEPLDENDLLVDTNGVDEHLISMQESHHVSYLFKITDLSRIIGNIVIAEFAPHRPALEIFDSTLCLRSLEKWHNHLPESLRSGHVDQACGAPFWASMLNASYHYARILLFRPKATECRSFPESERETRARMAADAITRISEDLLATETIHYAQLHMVPSLFGALSVHTLAISHKKSLQQQLAENKARQCILALKALAKIWPVGMWVVKAFSTLLRRLLSQATADRDSRQALTNRDIQDTSGESEVNLYAESAPKQSLPIESHILAHGSDCVIRNLVNECLPGNQIDGVPSNYLSLPENYPEYSLGGTDQLTHGSAWFECLEDLLDIELLQQQLRVDQ